MALHDYLKAMPKIELHVHLEGSIRPATLLKLARRHGITLPADTIEGLQNWYTFTDFDHFINIYRAISDCLRTPDDIELITREFLAGQAAQNIVYSEVTFTPYTHYQNRGIAFADQLAAINRARRWADHELGTRMGLVIDISRNVTPAEGIITAEWAIKHHGDDVIALGLGGPEVGHPPEKFTEAFALARDAGVPAVPHAGETEGPTSIKGALDALHAVRIGHGVRCLEDAALVAELRDRQIPLEVCPTSNVCLKVTPDFASHPLPQLMAEGLYVTLNSDDPPMFNTTLTDEYLMAADAFRWDAAVCEGLVLNAARASLLPDAEKATLESRLTADFARLRADHGITED
jgi:adenosine deaminase